MSNRNYNQIQIRNIPAPWLPLFFTLSNTKTDFMLSCVTVKGEFSTSWFSLSKLPSKKKTNDTNLRHTETTELSNQ